MEKIKEILFERYVEFIADDRDLEADVIYDIIKDVGLMEEFKQYQKQS